MPNAEAWQPAPCKTLVCNRQHGMPDVSFHIRALSLDQQMHRWTLQQQAPSGPYFGVSVLSGHAESCCVKFVTGRRSAWEDCIAERVAGCRALAEVMQYENCTDVQAACIPPSLAGQVLSRICYRP